LVTELKGLGDRADLDRYLAEQAQIHLDQFVAAGRAEGLAFDELYRRLRAMGGQRGLSNSEICLVAALWGARQEGAAIDHLPLADHFPADGNPVALDRLKAALRAADGFVLSTPVYFGDRGSLSQRFIEMLRADTSLRADLAGKVYGGLAVGAKRNGGQETTLIYQMLDMLDVGLLGVGNDSETTSQYGGTGHAGDVGTMPKDTYGINTSIGTGRRIARVTSQLRTARDSRLVDLPRVDLWVLQDRAGALVGALAPLFGTVAEDAEITVLDLLSEPIRPCIACDICPTKVGPDEEYRCIIKRRDDGVRNAHHDLLHADVIVPAVLSPKHRDGLQSVYQEFMERTRFLRRGDYVFTDRLVAPLVLAEVGATEHLDVRMMTSMLRHHTVMIKPIVGLLRDGRLINPEDVADGLAGAIAHGRRLLTGRLGSISLEHSSTAYQPVGYVLAQAKDNEKETMTAREQATRQRLGRLADEARRRLARVEGGSTAGAA
jgi:multimeric flavodoxin WrbA